MRVDGRILREGGAQVLQFGFLLEAGGRFALPPSPPGDALLQRGVVERGAAPEHRVQRPLLRGRRPELLFVRFAHRLWHGYTARLRRCRATYSRTARTTSLLIERSFSVANCLMAWATGRGKRMVMRVSSRSFFMVTL